MNTFHLGPVGGDNPVSPVKLSWARPRLGQFCLATTVAGVMRTQGHPGQDSGREWLPGI